MIAGDRLPTGVPNITGLKLLEILLSLNQPKSPPFIAVCEILNLIATFSNPSSSITFFNLLISDSNLSSSTRLVTISEINRYSISIKIKN